MSVALLPRSFFHILESGKHSSMHRVFPASGKNTLFLLPALHSKHFWLNVVDTKSHEIRVYDSMKKYIPRNVRNNYMHGLFTNLEAVIPDTQDLWHFDIYQCPQQQDKYNCGVYVLAFAREIIAGNEERIASLNISPTALREQIGRDLLQTEPAGIDLLNLNNQCWITTVVQLMGDLLITRH